MNQELPLFVYGTLMQGFTSPMTEKFKQGARFLGPASVCGKLYRIDWYPGAVPATDPSSEVDTVCGELYQIHSEELWQALDQYEGVGTGHEFPCEYVREITQLLDSPDSDFCKAWIYWYNWSVPTESQIESGKFEQ